MTKKNDLKPTAIIQKANKAIRIAVAKAIAEHKRLGLPIYVLEKNKVIRIPASRLPSR